jgi:alkylhydroperoxidase family enzyme
MDINAAVGGKAGLSREKMEAALGMKESSNLPERERIALAYADRVSATPVDVPDAFFADLQRLFSDREIVELTVHIAHENYNVSFLPILGKGEHFPRVIRILATSCSHYK